MRNEEREYRYFGEASAAAISGFIDDVESRYILSDAPPKARTAVRRPVDCLDASCAVTAAGGSALATVPERTTFTSDDKRTRRRLLHYAGGAANADMTEQREDQRITGTMSSRIESLQVGFDQSPDHARLQLREAEASISWTTNLVTEPYLPRYSIGGVAIPELSINDEPVVVHFRSRDNIESAIAAGQETSRRERGRLVPVRTVEAIEGGVVPAPREPDERYFENFGYLTFGRIVVSAYSLEFTMIHMRLGCPVGGTVGVIGLKEAGQRVP